MGYEWIFALNSVLIFIGAFIVIGSIDSHPEEASYAHVQDDKERGRSRTNSAHDKSAPLSMLQAIILPGVLAYCLCNACLKLVNYAFFFWFPLYLTDTYHWSEADADQLSIWYNIGGIIGSVVGGYITDRMGCRSPLIVGMLVCSIGSLIVYDDIGDDMLWNALVMTVFGITISGPYNLIVGSISIDLGSQPCLLGNTQGMATVSGLLDGTGSAGSTIGQLIIPYVQDTWCWKTVFYVFVTLNAMAILCILKRFVADMKSFRRYGAEQTPLLVDSEDRHED